MEAIKIEVLVVTVVSEKEKTREEKEETIRESNLHDLNGGGKKMERRCCVLMSIEKRTNDVFSETLDTKREIPVDSVF